VIRTSELAMNFLVNAGWQIVAVALVAWISANLLRNTAARYRHALWVSALVMSVALPVWSLFGSGPETRAQSRSVQFNAVRLADKSTSTSTGTTPTFVGDGAPESAPANDPLLATRRHPLVTAPSLLVVLALGYAIFLLYRGGRLWKLWSRTQSLRASASERELPARMKAAAAECREALGLKDATLVFSPIASTPFSLGGRRPLVILPEGFYHELPEDTLLSVLGHEMAHIARRDYSFNLVYEFLLLPISFHPLARAIKRQIDRTRELACDEMVTERLLDPEAHARSLVRVAASLVAPTSDAFMLGIFDANILEERIITLTRHSRRFGVRAGRLLAFTAIVLLCVSSIAVSTFSFELRTRASGMAVVDPATFDEVSNSRADGVVVQAESGKGQERSIPADTTRVENQSSLRSPGPQDRAQAACAAGRQGDIDAIPALISMLGDDSQTELIRCWTDGRWSPALATFKQPSPGEQAAIALASMGRSAFPALTEVLGSANSSVRRNAAWAIGELTKMPPGERDEAVMPLISLLGDSDSWVRTAAARALGELRDQRAGDRLIAALADGDARVRQTSAWALGEMKDERAVQTLCNVLLSDAQNEVRLTAAEALGEIRSQNALGALNQALNDLEPLVRVRARWAIAEIEDTRRVNP